MTQWQQFEDDADAKRDSGPRRATPITWLITAHAVVVWILVFLVLWLTKR